jgi:type II secretory pathway predicted ATPase ExeA
MDYIPELYVSSEKLNSQIARLVDIIKNGKAICSVMGDIKSGKSYLLNLLRDGFKESLWKYSDYEKIHVLFFNSEEIKEYSLTIFMQQIAEAILNKYYTSKEQIIVELKKYVDENNALVVVLLDNFKGEQLSSIASDSAKLLKLLKENFSCILSSNLSEMQIVSNGLRKGGTEHFSYTIHVPELSLHEAKELISKRMCYGLNQSSFQINEVFTERAVEAAWVESKGNPWVLISVLSDAHSYALKKESNIVTHEDIASVVDMFSRTPIQGVYEDHDKFLIQQALNNFPYRERQVCEYLIHKDATAKEITIYLYGELPSSEYRSKYMGTKSFLKRLKDKNVVVVKGNEGRSLMFGLNPKMRERLTQSSSDDKESVVKDETEIIAI